LRCVLPLLVFGCFLVTVGWAQRKNTAKHGPPAALTVQAQGRISVAFRPTADGATLAPGGPGQGTLDLGVVSYGGTARTSNVQVTRQHDRFMVSTKFGLSLDDPARSTASAAVLAALAYPETLHTIRLDGVTLTVTPQVVMGQARLGAVSLHRLEIEVPTSLTEKNAQLHNAIVFQVIPN
jgi:hypothetical protein